MGGFGTEKDSGESGAVLGAGADEVERLDIFGAALGTEESGFKAFGFDGEGATVRGIEFGFEVERGEDSLNNDGFF